MRQPVERALAVRLASGRGPVSPEMAAAARRHRVHLLLAASIAPDDCDPTLAAALKRDLQVAAAFDAWHAQEIATVLTALGTAGVDALLFKGTALAHSVYQEPHVRPRVDTDLLVRRSAVDEVDRVLWAAGWTRPIELEADIISAQRHYIKRAPGETTAHIDLHWKIANPQVFADAVSFDDVIARSIDVPALGRHARAAGPIDALLLACMHRVAHHQDSIDLLWLWDIHLLLTRLSGAERDSFVAVARQAAMMAVCQRGIQLASEYFGTPGGAELAGALEPGSMAEPSARFIGGLTQAAVARTDLAALTGWRARTRLISEHLFPSVAYMRTKYPRWPPVLLPLAYAARIARGAPRWLRRS